MDTEIVVSAPAEDVETRVQTQGEARDEGRTRVEAVERSLALLQCFPEPDGVYGPQGRRWLRGGSQRNVTVHPVVPATKLKAATQRRTKPQRAVGAEREREAELDTQDAG